MTSDGTLVSTALESSELALAPVSALGIPTSPDVDSSPPVTGTSLDVAPVWLVVLDADVVGAGVDVVLLLGVVDGAGGVAVGVEDDVVSVEVEGLVSVVDPVGVVDAGGEELSPQLDAERPKISPNSAAARPAADPNAPKPKRRRTTNPMEFDMSSGAVQAWQRFRHHPSTQSDESRHSAL